MAAKYDNDLRAALTDIGLPADWQEGLFKAFAARLRATTDAREPNGLRW